MPVTLPAVPPYYNEPRLEYKLAQDIQLWLDAKLGWLDRSYHIAKIGINAESTYGYPQIHANDGTKEHYDIRADSEIGAYSFIEIERPVSIEVYSDEITYFFSIVFWCNLDKIDAAKEYDFTSELIKDVVNSLEVFEPGNLEVETRPEKIFDKYSGIEQELKQFLMRRFSGFKVSFELTKSLTDECPGEPINTCQQNIERLSNLPDSVRQCVLDFFN